MMKTTFFPQPRLTPATPRLPGASTAARTGCRTLSSAGVGATAPAGTTGTRGGGTATSCPIAGDTASCDRRTELLEGEYCQATHLARRDKQSCKELLE